jgi:hypothetical protein
MSGIGLLRPVDLSVKINGAHSTCFKVNVSVTLRNIPDVILGAASTEGQEATDEALFPFKTNVELLVTDDCGNAVLRTLEFAGAGTKTVTVEVPTDGCNITPGSWARTFFVSVDPFNKIRETSEGRNNRARGAFICIT